MTEIKPVVTTCPKHWIKSRTLRFNALCAALAALEASFNLLQPHIPGNAFAYLTVLLAVGNAYLRVITSAPLIGKQQ